MGIRETMATAYYGTVAGGKAAAQKNKEKHGDDFFKRIGKLGGANGTTGGFATMTPCDCEVIEELHHKARCSGAKGGSLSRRKKAQE